MRKRIVMIIMGVALMALPIMAQSFAAQQPEQQRFQSVAPSATFQSTSAMKGSGSAYSANPTLNSDGTAAYSSASTTSSGPRKAKKEGEWEDEPLGPLPDDPGTPLGDAVLPLMLMALAFCGVVYLRRRKAALKG